MSEPFDPYRKWLGIPLEEQPPNHYRLLGIPLFESDLDVIENAAHRQMVYVRTFQNGRHAEQSQRLLNELASAKVCLLSPDRKQAYDLQLHADRAGGRDFLAAVAPPGSRSTHYGSRSRTARRYTLPLLLGGLGVAAVIGVVATLVVLEKQWLAPRSSSDEELAGQAADGKSGGSSLVVGRNSTRPPAVSTNSDASPESGALPNDDFPAAGVRTADARESRIRKQLDRVREMHAKRELGQAQALLDGVGVLSRDEELRAEKERLELIQKFLEDFWKAVDRGQSRVKQRLERSDDADSRNTVTFEFRGETIELQRDEQKKDAFHVLVDGRPWTGSRRELPANAAVPLALIGMDDDDGFGRFQIATFLFVDAQGNRDENRRLANEFYQLAVKMAGQPNVFLAAEFEIPAPISEDNSPEISPESFKVRPRRSPSRTD